MADTASTSGDGEARSSREQRPVVRLASAAVARVRALRRLRRRRDTHALSEGDYAVAVERLKAEEPLTSADDAGGRFPTT
jgi:hypothetical protein